MWRGFLGGVLGCLLTALVGVVGFVGWQARGAGDRVERPPDGVAVPATATVARAVVDVSRTFAGELAAGEAPVVVAESGIVSRMPLAHGAQAEPGDVVAEVNGRPLVALPMRFGLWRDLTAGASGRDVQEFQRALGRAGFYSGPSDGEFGLGTEAATRRLYRSIGYPPGTREAGAGSADTGPEEGGEGPGDAKGEEARPGEPRPTPPATVLTVAAGEIVPVGDAQENPRLLAPGVRVGTRLGGDVRLSVTGRGTRVTVDDRGALARDWRGGGSRGRELSLVGDPSQPAVEAQLLAASGSEQGTVLDVRLGGDLPPGPVSGTLVVASSGEAVLAVPVTALLPDARGDFVLRVRDGGVAREVAVTVGLRGDRLVQVSAAGLAEGDVVELP